MAPELQPGDRIVVDTFRRWPTLGEPFVIWDGNSIVIKRYERVWDSEPPTFRLHSAGRFHPPYTCIASAALHVPYHARGVRYERCDKTVMVSAVLSHPVA